MNLLNFPLKDKSERLTDETFLRLNRWCQRGLGLWPEDSFRKTLPIVIFCMSSFVLTSVCQFYFVYNHLTDYKELLILIPPAGSYFICWLKISCLFGKRKAFREIFAFFKNEWINEKRKENMEVIYEFNILSHKYELFLFCTISSTYIAHLLIPLLINIRNLIIGANYARLVPFPSDYPFDIATSPNFEIAFVFVSWGGFLTIFAIPAVDGSFIELNIYLAGQFKLISTDLNYLLINEIGHTGEENVYNFSRKELDCIHRRLCKITEKHTDAINICNKIVNVYVSNVLLHFVTSAFLVCVACINFTIFTGIEKFRALFLSLLTLTQLYLYCAGGNYVREASQEVAEAAYSLCWYKMDTPIKKVIQMMILRSQKGHVIKVPFFEVTLLTFISILRAAGSYISLLNALL